MINCHTKETTRGPQENHRLDRRRGRQLPRLRPNRSSIVAEAVRDYRARELERSLEMAYREDHDETAELAAEWQASDAEIDE